MSEFERMLTLKAGFKLLLLIDIISSDGYGISDPKKWVGTMVSGPDDYNSSLRQWPLIILLKEYSLCGIFNP